MKYRVVCDDGVPCIELYFEPERAYQHAERLNSEINTCGPHRVQTDIGTGWEDHEP